VAFFHTRVVAKLTRQTWKAIRETFFGLILAYFASIALRAVSAALAACLALHASSFFVMDRPTGPACRAVEAKLVAITADLALGARFAVLFGCMERWSPDVIKVCSC
jgi:hypothetical protein